MRIEGRVELTLADQYAAIYWAGPRAFRIAVPTLAAIAVLVVALELLSPRANLTIIGFAAFFIVSCFGMVAVGHSRLKPAQKRIEYLIDRERIVIRDQSGMAFATPWSSITAIEDRGRGLVLRQSSGGRWLVKRAFSDEALAALKKMVPPPSAGEVPSPSTAEGS